MCFLSTLQLKLAHLGPISPGAPFTRRHVALPDLGNRPTARLQAFQKDLCFLRFSLKAISISSSILCVGDNARVRLFVFICCFFWLFHSAKKVLALAFLPVPEDVSCMIHHVFFAFKPLKRFRVAFSLLCGRSLCVRVFVAEESGEFAFLSVGKDVSCVIQCIFFAFLPLTRFRMAFSFLCVEVQIQL